MARFRLLFIDVYKRQVLDFCGIEAPDGVAGVSQKKALVTPGESVRDWAIVEHNHERGKVNVRTYINQKYKLSIYLNQPQGELCLLYTSRCV